MPYRIGIREKAQKKKKKISIAQRKFYFYWKVQKLINDRSIPPP